MSYTFAQIQAARAMVAATQQLTPPVRKPNVVKRVLQWQVQVDSENERLRPQSYDAHEFQSANGSIIDRTTLCIVCMQTFDHLAHFKGQPTGLTGLEFLNEVVIDNESPDDALEGSRLSQAEYGDADERPDDRRTRSGPDPVRLAPRYAWGVQQYANGVFARVRAVETPGETERELDFISPHRSSAPTCSTTSQCRRCRYGRVIGETCTQCGHHRDAFLTPRKASEFRDIEFRAFI